MDAFAGLYSLGIAYMQPLDEKNDLEAFADESGLFVEKKIHYVRRHRHVILARWILLIQVGFDGPYLGFLPELALCGGERDFGRLRNRLFEGGADYG